MIQKVGQIAKKFSAISANQNVGTACQNLTKRKLEIELELEIVNPLINNTN